MSREIEERILKCSTCQKYSRSNTKQPLKSHEIPELPWQKVGIDFAHIKATDYLIIIDYLSKFIVVKKVGLKTANPIIKSIEETFSYFGIPMEIVSDNGPPFNSFTFKIFTKTYDIKHTTSSPTYAKSNGLVERAVQTVKGLITKAIESKNITIENAILNYNTTPKSNMPSPSEMLMGRKLRSNLLMTKSLLTPKYDYNKYHKVIKNEQEKQKKYYDRSSKELDDLNLNQHVLVQMGKRNWTPAKVTRKCDEPESYEIITDDGTELRRNRIHLRPFSTQVKEDTPITSANSEKKSEIAESKVSESDDLNQSVREAVVSEQFKPCTNIGDVNKNPSDNQTSNGQNSRPKRLSGKPKYLKDYVTN